MEYNVRTAQSHNLCRFAVRCADMITFHGGQYKRDRRSYRNTYIFLSLRSYARHALLFSFFIFIVFGFTSCKRAHMIYIRLSRALEGGGTGWETLRLNAMVCVYCILFPSRQELISKLNVYIF